MMINFLISLNQFPVLYIEISLSTVSASIGLLSLRMFLTTGNLNEYPVSYSGDSTISENAISRTIFGSTLISRPLVEISSSFILPVRYSSVASSRPVPTSAMLLKSSFSFLSTLFYVYLILISDEQLLTPNSVVR